MTVDLEKKRAGVIFHHEERSDGVRVHHEKER